MKCEIERDIRRQVPYSQFLEQVQADKVEQATIGREQIRYQLKEGATSESEESRSFKTIAVRSSGSEIGYVSTNFVGAFP
ncbi:hypothetical protein MC7420_5931 [Coleofasciculus chthonoplastes PCC 7420]|uniref:Peptidase M41 FtsH extracellular domain-containing protein n=1 Tax=Coleofasciculus chthonoplastes PCC 7420 TaxID=118168 RepID=B4VW14_9CYAN|nr:ATP-dependent metallopeptidase FtsH/Yme1/Tma family protein [Coleofasciculus chthonoplastes]EDX74051.1 hypothetical protein MC7420_5931 [Coleofasciculus chthonoplastes PCC 7420]